MKWILPLAFVAFLVCSAQSQNESYVVKRYAKVFEGQKYFIIENIFSDGQIENFVTNVPIEELKEKNQHSSLIGVKNIFWDEDSKTAGLQKDVKDYISIQNAFNNAITIYEKQKGLNKGSIERINLSSNFDFLNPEFQSKVIIEKLRSAFIPMLIESNKNLKWFDEKELQVAALASNGDDIPKYVNIQSIYNWFFVDQMTGWRNKALLLGLEYKPLNRTCDFAGNNFLDSDEMNSVLYHIIPNPTLSMVAHFNHGQKKSEILAHHQSKTRNLRLFAAGL